VFEPTIYHTRGEQASLTRSVFEPTIYHTRGEQASLTRSVLEPTIYHTRGEQAIQYTTDAVKTYTYLTNIRSY